MFENLINLFKKIGRKDQIEEKSKNTAKERLHLVLMQDRANVSADFLDMMRQEIIDVIKKYIDVDEKDIDVKLTNKTNEDGTMGAPALYANIPITGIKEEIKKEEDKNKENTDSKDDAEDKEEVEKSELEEKVDVEEKAEAEEDAQEDSEEQQNVEDEAKEEATSEDDSEKEEELSNTKEKNQIKNK